jgi:hypothetical protein
MRDGLAMERDPEAELTARYVERSTGLHQRRDAITARDRRRYR